MRRICIHADALADWAYIPGQHVRVQINDPLSAYGIVRPAETLRTYTICNFSAADHTFDLFVHLYDGPGIGLTWARSVEVGGDATFWVPLGDFFVRDATHHVFVGEETATVAFGPMIESLGSDARVTGVLESNSVHDEPPLPGVHPLRRVHRNGKSATASTVLVNAVADLELPAEPATAYLAGEAKTLQLVRNHLVRDRGWSRRDITVKPFWTRGKRGLHH